MDALPFDGSLESLGQRVRRFRDAAKLSQPELARRVRISQSAISQIENGRIKGPLRRRTVCDLADALGVEVTDLVGGDPLYDLADIEAIPAVRAGRGALPREDGEMLGRAAEVAALAGIARGDDRLVTLVGPGGVGKTRLAVHVAHGLAHEFSGGAIFVPLETCTDAGTVLSAVARAAGLHERDARPLRTRLLTDLDRGRWLLVLDNAEHVLEPIATLCAELLSSYPGLTIVVTSRAALNVKGERRFPLGLLRLPGFDDENSAAAAAASPAVQLFVERAQRVDVGFRLTDANAKTVAAICRRLDGIPLAIEIAAARMAVFAPAQLLARLDRRLETVVGSGRDLPERQRSLRASTAWSYALLDAGQQRFWRRLAVFAGGFTLDDAAAVAGDEAGMPDGEHAPAPWPDAAMPQSVDRVAALLDWNLLVRLDTPEADPRFGMLETVREFAAEQLALAGETAIVQERRLDRMLTLAEEALPRMFTADEAAWVARLQDHHANLAGAMEWAFTEGSAAQLELGLRLAGALADFWYVSGQLSDGRAWLTQAVARAADRASSVGKARSLAGLCLFEQIQAAPALALAHGQEALAVGRRMDDWPTIGRASLLLGNLAMMRGDIAEARSWHQQALVVFERLDDAPSIAVALIDLGMDDFRQGDCTAALARVDAAIAVAEPIGDVWDSIVAIRLKADVLRAQGDIERAAALYAQSLELGRRHNSDRETADSLTGIAVAAAVVGDTECAAQLFGAAARIYRRLGISLPPPMFPHWDDDVGRVQSSMGGSRFARAWEALSQEQAVAAAVEFSHRNAAIAHRGHDGDDGASERRRAAERGPRC